jgi:hypothetical protein
MPLILS